MVLSTVQMQYVRKPYTVLCIMADGTQYAGILHIYAVDRILLNRSGREKEDRSIEAMWVTRTLTAHQQHVASLAAHARNTPVRFTRLSFTHHVTAPIARAGNIHQVHTKVRNAGNSSFRVSFIGRPLSLHTDWADWPGF